jgi:urease accessory protein
MHGDGLVLEDGRIIEVVAAKETITEIFATDSQQLARLAWHIGNRHVPAEILSDRIRIMPDPVIETMAYGLGGKVREILDRFEPEGGAYGDAGGGHDAHGHHSHEPHP